MFLLANLLATRLLGSNRYDYLWLDTEHGTASPASAEHPPKPAAEERCDETRTDCSPGRGAPAGMADPGAPSASKRVKAAGATGFAVVGLAATLSLLGVVLSWRLQTGASSAAASGGMVLCGGVCNCESIVL